MNPISVLEELHEVVCQMSLLGDPANNPAALCGGFERLPALTSVHSFTAVSRLLFKSYKESNSVVYAQCAVETVE